MNVKNKQKKNICINVIYHNILEINIYILYGELLLLYNSYWHETYDKNVWNGMSIIYSNSE